MIILRKATTNDLHDISCIHKERFSDHYLGKFPLSTISEFYRGFTNDPFIFLVAECDDKIVGFVMGGNGVDIRRYEASFQKNNYWRRALQIISHPKTWEETILRIYKLVRSVFKKKKAKHSIAVESTPRISLLSVAVAQSAERKGIGSLLVDHFTSCVKPLCNEYRLCVNPSNKKAIDFYEKKGFVVDYSRKELVCYKYTIEN